MKGEAQLRELLAEVLRRQDQMHEAARSLERQIQIANARLGNAEEDQPAHQQLIRTLAVSQQQQREKASLTAWIR